MKPIFARKRPDPSAYAHSGYNLPGLPTISILRVGPRGRPHDVIRSVWGGYDLVVYHCWGSMTPDQVPLLFEIRSMVEGALVMFHHSDQSLQYRRAASMVGWKRHKDYPKVPYSMWNAGGSVRDLRCKTKLSLEAQPKKFYRGLLRSTRRVLEVFPEACTVSKVAVSLGIPVTLFLRGDGDNNDLIQKLGGSL